MWWRQAQGFDVSIEPTLEWDSVIEALVEEVRKGYVHPTIFANAQTHPADPYFPAPNKFQMEFFRYDLWCQVMTRAIILLMRSIDRIEHSDPGDRTIHFSCTPLIIGSGVLKIGDMNADA
jgi:hypothetical protein